MLARSTLAALCALVPACSAVAVVAPAPHDEGPPQAEPDHMRVGAEFGQRDYRNSNWEQLDSTSVLGFTVAHEPPEWPLGADFGLYWLSDRGNIGATRLDLNTWEGYAGVMKSATFLDGLLVLHGGAGAAITYLNADPDDPLLSHEDASWTSGYARAGLTVHLSSNFEFGLTWRSARGGSFRIAGVELDGDYDQAAFTLSGSW